MGSPTRRRLLTAAPAAVLVATLPRPADASDLPPEWLAIEDQIKPFAVDPAEAHAAMLRAYNGGLQLTDFSGWSQGTRTRYRPLVLYFGDWDLGTYVAVEAKRLLRYGPAP